MPSPSLSDRESAETFPDAGRRTLGGSLPGDAGRRTGRRRQYARLLPARPERLRPVSRQPGYRFGARGKRRPAGLCGGAGRGRPLAAHGGPAPLRDPPVLSLPVRRRPARRRSRPPAWTRRGAAAPCRSSYPRPRSISCCRPRARARARRACGCWRCSSCSTPPGCRVSELVCLPLDAVARDPDGPDRAGQGRARAPGAAERAGARRRRPIYWRAREVSWRRTRTRAGCSPRAARAAI